MEIDKILSYACHVNIFAILRYSFPWVFLWFSGIIFKFPDWKTHIFPLFPVSPLQIGIIPDGTIMPDGTQTTAND